MVTYIVQVIKGVGNMPYDGIVANAAVCELSGLLAGGRIEKVYQTERDEITLLIHSMGKDSGCLPAQTPPTPDFILQSGRKKIL